MGATKDYIHSYTFALVRVKKQVENTIRNFYSQTAPPGKLTMIGKERNCPRYPLAEDITEYRERVIKAWTENIGRGGVMDIRRVLTGYGLIFNSYNSGFTGSEPTNSFNLITQTLGSAVYNGDYDYDGSIKYNNPAANSFNIEIKRPTGSPTSAENIKQMRSDLFDIVRASINQIGFIDIYF